MFHGYYEGANDEFLSVNPLNRSDDKQKFETEALSHCLNNLLTSFSWIFSKRGGEFLMIYVAFFSGKVEGNDDTDSESLTLPSKLARLLVSVLYIEQVVAKWIMVLLAFI